MTNNTALQVTNFNFYGDELIALKDNATGEIYTSINHVLRNIGFTERQIKHIHKKWSEDIIVAKGCKILYYHQRAEIKKQHVYQIGNFQLHLLRYLSLQK